MKAEDIKRIAVVGAGLMGHGIAQEFALAGYEVHLHDLTEEKLQQAINTVQDNLQMLTGMGLTSYEEVESVPTKIHPGTLLKEAARNADVVIETVFEDLALKRNVFQELDEICPQHTILASNSSAIIPSKLASATQRPDRVLITHYFNPPYLLPLVEVVRSEETSDETVTTIYNLLIKLKKSPVVVEKEIPGFIGNRLQGALLREALSLVQKGVATPQDVDAVIKQGIGRRWSVAGIFEIFEIAGWDLVLDTQIVAPEEQTEATPSPKEIVALLEDKVEQGELGVKTGKGFYEWTPESAKALKRRIAIALIKIADRS